MNKKRNQKHQRPVTTTIMKTKPAESAKRVLRRSFHDITSIHERNLYMRYLGCLKLLEECSPFVREDIRESIELAMNDAASNHKLSTRRVLDRIEIEVDDA